MNSAMDSAMNSRPDENEGIGETRRTSDQPIPNTRAPEAGSPPAAGRISPAEKSEPAGVPIQEQRHNADPNAPQTEVVPPGMTQTPESETGGIPRNALQDGPDLGTDEARERAQTPSVAPPSDSPSGSSVQRNDPNELPAENDDENRI